MQYSSTCFHDLFSPIDNTFLSLVVDMQITKVPLVASLSIWTLLLESHKIVPSL